MSLLAKGDTFKAYAKKLYNERRLRAPTTREENSLWHKAITAPYGGIVIGREDQPYLLRAYLLPERVGKTSMPGMYLHYFVRGDDDPNPHNHPWLSAKSLILTGGYTEQRLNTDGGYLVQKFLPGSWNTIHSSTYHKVELLYPELGCWTAMTTAPRIKPSDGYDWGFFDMDQRKHIPWKEYPATSDQDGT
jgi:hypothetical protein